jgi:MOSC domain-containing protein YiiM
MTLEWQIRKDDKLMGWNGRLEHIHITDAGRAAMRRLDEAQLVAGKGIEGDRYFLGTGTYSMKPEPGRQVTLIEAETLEALARDEGIELMPQEHRRNLTVSGVPLNHLVGRQFRVGEVVLEGARLNFPCKYLELVTGKAVYAPLLNRSGLNCIIVEGGTIRPGDALTPA